MYGNHKIEDYDNTITCEVPQSKVEAIVFFKLLHDQSIHLQELSLLIMDEWDISWEEAGWEIVKHDKDEKD